MPDFQGSTAITFADGPQRCASSTVRKPVPAPTSSTVIPGLMGNRSRRRSPNGADHSGSSSYSSPNPAAVWSISSRYFKDRTIGISSDRWRSRGRRLLESAPLRQKPRGQAQAAYGDDDAAGDQNHRVKQ